MGKVNKKKRATKVLRASGILSFPQDFFEHCQNQSSDIEFGGQDVLQVCNVELKRLSVVTETSTFRFTMSAK